ncbi:transcriptional regulator [Cellulomonas chitinilytica]|uniref:Transcriptional regulator n=1 Tax=Cellulomonas chitinilytica TaxID=398759 RepID=A0A919TXQ8_9CELL|nr:LCP family protein [Cellulomonas chitinilytica]GIG19700.1 transcriptional regulator [Cellulomonas chitinilytica]
MSAPTQPPSHARGGRGVRTVRVVALVLVGSVAFAGAAAGAVWWRLQSNIETLDTAGLLGDDRPSPSSSATAADPADVHAGSPVNLLLLGSDDRRGANAEIGGADEGMRSDTTVVAHISADRTQVVLASIPRDSLVDIPSCTMTDGSTSPALSDAPFNKAFATGWDHGGDVASAAACAWKTVESTTGVRVDGVMVVDFAGFQTMVDAIGGVPMCLAQDYDDEKTGLHVTAGQHTFDGPTALQFARAREDIGDGSDLGRIGRQQDFLAATAREVLSRDVLTSAPALLSFADAATRSLSASTGFDRLTDLVGLGRSLQHVGSDQIVFVMTPVVDSTRQRYKVEWTSEATTLWARIAADEPVGREVPTSVPALTPTSAGTAPPATSPPATTTAPPQAPADAWEPRSGVKTSADDTSVCG